MARPRPPQASGARRTAAKRNTPAATSASTPSAAASRHIQVGYSSAGMSQATSSMPGGGSSAAWSIPGVAKYRARVMTSPVSSSRNPVSYHEERSGAGLCSNTPASGLRRHQPRARGTGPAEKLGVLIGLDSGEALVVTMGHPATKQHKDIIGATVSLAAKIQARAEPGTILVGQTVDRNLRLRRFLSKA